MSTTTISRSRHPSFKNSCQSTPAACIVTLRLTTSARPSRQNSESSHSLIQTPTKSIQIPPEQNENEKSPSLQHVKLNVCKLPTEILEIILSCALHSHRDYEHYYHNHEHHHDREYEYYELLDRASSSSSFSAIAGFSAACRSFRQIALRSFCASLCIRSRNCWGEGMPNVSDLAGWTRVLYSYPIALSAPSAIHLTSFTLLQHVHIDFFAETLSNQHQHLPTILSVLPAHLTSLSFINLPSVRITLMEAIAAKFAGLERLVLSCAERLDNSCCLFCFSESGGCVNHSPVPDEFPTAKKMAEDFGTALRPLTKLTTLHLGVFLSHECVFYEHILMHCSSSPSPSAHSAPTARGQAPTGPEWCPACFEAHASTVRDAELAATMVLAQRLVNVKRVTWASFFARRRPAQVQVRGVSGNGNGGDSDSRTTVVWVQRGEGRIRVRRKPW